MASNYRIGVDVGGTFTDLVIADEGGRIICLAKAASRPDRPEEGVVEALGRAAAMLNIDTKTLLGACRCFVHGTTVATNALLTGKGARAGLLTTEGFRDALTIRRGLRENVWDHRAPHPPLLVLRHLSLPAGGRIGRGGEETAPLDEDSVKRAAEVFTREKVKSVAVCLFNAYLNPSHEERAGKILAKALPDAYITLSSHTAPIMGEYERTSTAAVSAFLGPRISGYLQELEHTLRNMGYAGPLMLLQSNGGMATVAHCRRHPASLVLSGPAAGAAAGSIYAEAGGTESAVFFDMGGTSCDVTLLRDGKPGMVDQSAVGGYHVALPSVEVHTIGTGGGTIVWADSGGGLRVGPDSAGAEPGPASYGKGGDRPTITDAHLILGRLGLRGLLDGEMPLSVEKAELAFARVAEALGMSVPEVAAGAVRVASRQMAGAVETICARHGADPRQMALVAGGGAGGLSAAAVALHCKMLHIIVPREAAGVCAVGMAGSPVRYNRLKSRTLRLHETSAPALEAEISALREELAREVESAGGTLSDFTLTSALDMRYPGQAWHLSVEVEGTLDDKAAIAIGDRFHEAHKAAYGHHRPGEPVEITGFRVHAEAGQIPLVFNQAPEAGTAASPRSHRRAYFEGAGSWEEAAVWRGEDLNAASLVVGPAIIEEPTTTILIEPGDTLRLGGGGAFIIEVVPAKAASVEPAPKKETAPGVTTDTTDSVSLAILQQRLDVIAREMGIIMQRTARSTIFSQAHDFSCFICDPEGRLVSQADGLPIHTGSGGFAVRGVLKDFEGNINPGDLFLLNDPYMGGGNHLPDWTVIAPVFVEGGLAGFVSNRAHQVDVGGGVIGTYNSDATEIFHEGFRITPVKIHDRGEERFDLIRLILANTRAPEVIAHDFAAMVGSTHIGSVRLSEIGEEMGREALVAGLAGLLDYSEDLMRAELAVIPDGVYIATEFMNTDCFEPAEIPVKLTLTKKGTDITADFTGSAPQIKGYKNSPIANTCSALYVGISSLMDPLIPHNEGTYRPIKIIALPGTVVNASFPAPVTLCTVFPSHEIAQCVWKALADVVPGRVSAAWAKTAYPVTAGYDARGEFFVIYHWGGGPGAGAVEGRDGFPLIGNMPTLGALTIPNLEHYEQDYPIRFIRQELRMDGGGPGRWRGGTGVYYEAELDAPVSCSTRGESCRTITTFGLHGGGPGAIARVLFGQEGALTDLPQYANVDLPPGRLLIEGPGGGGFGDPFTRPAETVAADVRDGLVSVKSAKEDYGVVVDPVTFEINEKGTGKVRGDRKK